MSARLRTEVPLSPLYLKFAADQFSNNNASEAIRFFELACSGPGSLENQVYEQIYRIHQQASKIPFSHIQDREYGKKAFHGADSLSSTALEMATAIKTVLRQERIPLENHEDMVHKCLWELHGRPEGDRAYGKNAFNCMYGKYATFDEKLSAIRTYAEQVEAMDRAWDDFIDQIQERPGAPAVNVAPELQRVQSPAIARELDDIKTILNSSTVYVDFLGNRHLVSEHDSIDMDTFVEKLKIVSREYKSFTRADRENGLECVKKVRAFYLQSDTNFFAKIRFVIDIVIRLPYKTYEFIALIFCQRIPRDYSQRECIWADGMYSVGPESIESNFQCIG